MSEYNRLKNEIEGELYAALEALESDDLITVRQCAARTQSEARDAWKIKRTEEDTIKSLVELDD